MWVLLGVGDMLSAHPHECRAERAQATTTQRMSKIRDLVPPMIALCSASVHSTDPQEELVMKTFEILFEMSGLPSKVMQPVLAPLVQFSMEVRHMLFLSS
jgi:hypothetical protein